MQNILIHLSQEGISRKAWQMTFLVIAYVGVYAVMGAAGDGNPNAILRVDPIQLLLLQGLLAGLFFVLLPGLFVSHALHYPMRELLTPFNFRDLFYVIVIGVSSLIVLSAVVQWNLSIEFPASDFQAWAESKEAQLKMLTEHIVNFQSPTHFLLAIVVIGIIAAFGEELLFRGLLQNLLGQVSGNVHVGIWVSAFLFSAIHLQFYGFFPRLLLGALFGYLYLWSGRLSVAILAHFLHNSISLILVYLSMMKLESMPITSDQMDKAAPWHIVTIFLVIGVVAVFSYRKHQIQV